MPEVIFYEYLDLEQKSSFMDGREGEFVYFFGLLNNARK